MSLNLLFSISIALALDAFGVALSIGLNKGLEYKKKIICSIFFGFFQFLLAFLGALLGWIFNKYVTTVPGIIGGAIVSSVGVLMIKEGFTKENNHYFLNLKVYVVLAISVSIDAMVIGFTVLNTLAIFDLFLDSIFIGLTAFIISLVGFLISKYLKKIKIVSSYADYIGGIILILFGIKMMFT